MLQAADLVLPRLGAPESAMRVLVVLALLGLPVALVLAWTFEVRPDGGIGREPEVGEAAPEPVRWLPGRTLLLVVVLLVGGATGWMLNSVRASRSAADAGGAPTVAVLPFSNAGAAEDEYFADGMSDALRGKLAALDGLVVIASSSSRPYKGSPKTPREIGRELGARYLLTGTVRWARGADGESRVQVSPELVAAEEGTTRWQAPFDAVLSDVFTVQGEIATRVADALSVTLLESDRRSLAERPTEDLEAYDEFLRASALAEQAQVGAALQRLSAEGFQRAVELDPEFALAWARLARAHMAAYWFGEDHEDPGGRLAAARAAADRTLALAPDLVEAHLADAYYWYWGHRDYERALVALGRARALNPHDAQVEFSLAAVLRRQGRFDESVEHLRRSIELDRRNVTNHRELALTLIATGGLAEADTLSALAIDLAPDAIGNYLFRAQVQYAREESDDARATLAHAMRVLGSERVATEVVNRQWTRWLGFTDSTLWRVLETQPLNSQVVDTGSFLLFRAEWQHLQGRRAAAAALADSALVYLDRSAFRARDDWWFHGQAAHAQAIAGRPVEARLRLEDAHATLVRAPDAWEEPYLAHHTARVTAVLGDADATIVGLEAALRTPTPIPRAFIRDDLRFAFLREDPRFVALVR